MMKSLLAAAIIAGTAAPAFAAEYYVVRGPDKRCRVVESRPTESTIVQVGPMAFVTREKAEEQVKILCRDDLGNVEVERVR
jgi:hypothetical protein